MAETILLLVIRHIVEPSVEASDVTLYILTMVRVKFSKNGGIKIGFMDLQWQNLGLVTTSTTPQFLKADKGMLSFPQPLYG